MKVIDVLTHTFSYVQFSDVRLYCFPGPEFQVLKRKAGNLGWVDPEIKYEGDDEEMACNVFRELVGHWHV